VSKEANGTSACEANNTITLRDSTKSLVEVSSLHCVRSSISREETIMEGLDWTVAIPLALLIQAIFLLYFARQAYLLTNMVREMELMNGVPDFIVAIQDCRARRFDDQRARPPSDPDVVDEYGNGGQFRLIPRIRGDRLNQRNGLERDIRDMQPQPGMPRARNASEACNGLAMDFGSSPSRPGPPGSGFAVLGRSSGLDGHQPCQAHLEKESVDDNWADRLGLNEEIRVCL
jgi:hypothetical protein